MYILFSYLHFSSLLFSSVLLQVEKAKFVLARISLTRFATMAKDYPPREISTECHVDAWVKSCAGDEASGSDDLPLSPPQDAQISVHTIGGTTFLVNVSLQWNSLFDVTKAIADLKVLKGCEFDQMRLTLGGRRLNEELCHCLSSYAYGIKHGSQLCLVVVPSESEKCMICEQNSAHDIDDICCMCARCANDINDMG